MEYVIKELLHPEEDDEANFIYSELDEPAPGDPAGGVLSHPVCALPTAGIWDTSEVLNPDALPGGSAGHWNRPGEVEVRSHPPASVH